MVRFELDGLKEVRQMLDSKTFRQATRQALNDAAGQGRTAASRSIREKFNVKAGDLKQRIRITSKANANDLSVTIQATGRPLSLVYFGAVYKRGRTTMSRAGTKTSKRATSRGGVTVRILKGQPATRLPNSFMATVQAGRSGRHMGVFERAGRSRLPIFERRVVTVASMFGQANPQQALEETVADAFVRRLIHHLERRSK